MRVMTGFKLFRNMELYDPELLGIRDILVYDDKIIKIEKDINFNLAKYEAYDCSGLLCVPGFVDGHVHIIGGGGEGGFFTRTTPGEPEAFFKVGTTTVIGLLGTDAVTRTHSELLGQARKFTHSNLNTYIMTGSYSYPPMSLTGSIKTDIVFIPEFIGVGEVAIADHRSSGISPVELRRLGLDSRVSGMLAGKAGKIIVHLGGSDCRLEVLKKSVERDDVPASQFLPTHINRTEELLEDGILWINDYNGYIDFTAGDETAEILSSIVNSETPLERILISTDAWGSKPVFDNGQLVSIERAGEDPLLKTFRKLVLDHSLPVQQALKPFTSNVSDYFGLKNGTGHIREGEKASFVLFTSDFNIKKTVSNGRIVWKK